MLIPRTIVLPSDEKNMKILRDIILDVKYLFLLK